MLLGDMPRVSGEIVDALVGGYHASGGRAICVPVSGGRRGNPVLWPREFFLDMMGLLGDIGARPLLSRHRERIREIPLESEAIFLDVDEPADTTTLSSVNLK